MNCQNHRNRRSQNDSHPCKAGATTLWNGWTSQMLVISLVISGVALGGSALHAAGQPFEKKLDKAVQEFKSKKAAAARFTVKRMNRDRAEIKKDKTISESTRAERLRQLDLTIRNFKNSGVFPTSTRSFELEVIYQSRLNRAFAPIVKILESELKIANRNEDSVYTNKLLGTKRKLESELLAAQPISNGTIFDGKRQKIDGTTIPYKLRIDYISDSGDFEGTVDDNHGIAGHWRYRVVGQKIGNIINFRMSENLRGKFTGASASGVVSGSRMMAQLNLKTAKNKSINRLSLRR